MEVGGGQELNFALAKFKMLVCHPNKVIKKTVGYRPWILEENVSYRNLT